MNITTDYERIAVNLGTKEKAKLIKYITARGWSVSYVIRKLVEKLLSGEIKL